MKRGILKLATTDISYTYALVDPRSNEIKYIGITGRGIRVRLLDHIRGAKTESDANLHKRAWIRQLLDLSLEPSIVVLETCPIQDSSNSEIWWIALCKQLGFSLTNLTDGGDFPPGWSGKTHSEETKQKQSKSIRAYYEENNHPFKGGSLSSKHVENIAKAKKKNGTYHKNWLHFVSEREAKKAYHKRTDNSAWRESLSIATKNRLSDPTKNPMYGKRHSAISTEKNRLSNQMSVAYEHGDYLLLSELQEDYFNLTGSYQPNYSEFSYSEWH